MCEFPSWIETDDGEVHFLTDRAIAKLVKMEGKSSDWTDYIGHESIRNNLAIKGGRDCESVSLPHEIQSAIEAGKMKRMAKAAGYDEVFLRGLHEIKQGRVLVLGWAQVTAWGNSQVTARENSQVTAWENSQVTAWGNSRVTARENSQVTDKRVKNAPQ